MGNDAEAQCSGTGWYPGEHLSIINSNSRTWTDKLWEA